MTKKFYLSAFLFVFVASFWQTAYAQLTITNDTLFNTESQMFLANELFFSGEPFAEDLGYDLDELDPMNPDSPDSIAYTFGIENYEYSRYLLNTLSGRSGMGLHIMWSPVISQMAAMQPESFDGMFTGGTANGFKEDDMMMMTVGMFAMHANQTPPANPFPQFADFMLGDNTLPQTVAADFQMDWGSTRWNRSKMQKVLNPGAMGMSMMKQYLWSRDMLGAFHNSLDEGIEADGVISPDSLNSPNFNPNNDVFYGGNNVDGFIGQMLTAAGINKTMHLINFLAYDGTSLGAVSPPTYDPANGIKYFPHQIVITESQVNPMLPPKKDDQMTVIDPSSHLFDQLAFLWGTTGFKNMMNPDINDAEHYAYHEVFDGSPFPAPMSQTGTSGPYDLMTGASKVIFQNIMAMHFNTTEGTFVDVSNLVGGAPVQDDLVSAREAGYTLVVLSQFADEFVGTPLEMMANNAIIAQANFIVNSMKDNTNGGFYNSYTIGTGSATTTKKLATQAAIVRGLYAAYNHTGNSTYLTEANAAYNFMLNNFYVPQFMTFRTEMGNDMADYNTETLALIVGALREAKLTGNQADAEIILVRFGKSTIDKMLLTEAEQSGEDGSNADADGIPYIAGGNQPFVFADHATASLQTTGTNDFNEFALSTNIYPNPSGGMVNIEFTNTKNFQSASLSVYDIMGKMVSTKQLNLAGGFQSIPLDLSNLTAGTYLLRMANNSQVLSIKKMIIR